MLNEIKKNICIITDINGIYGYGHFTRMNLIANRLADIYDFTFSSINNKSELYKRVDIKTIEFNKIGEIKPYIVIVDAREVEEKYISYLKKISSVIIVDSVGSERRLADIVIEMLPNLDNSKEVNIKPFIATILNNSIKPIYNEDSPILVYLGFNKQL
ncbi:2-polyprenyl-3-methyl-5-hydroxy-6-metoxy-1,4-benzoquinol methylase, partial [Brachyspira pilosicoli]|nr:2-polyprenyl-3-methyl-5-hydroxy-6-metoxy-1,4-benzoquinol methylase [Brachyspira pilosicoli]